MNNLKISIITVVLNDVLFIEKTILSVINQTYKNIEYIIIDGLSNDGTIEVIKKYISNIAIFISEKDKGIYDAMNKGILKSKGDFIIFINSGDYLINNNIIEDIAQIINKNSNILLFTGAVLIEYNINNKLSYQKYNAILSKENLKKWIQPPHQATFYNRKLFNDIGLFSLEFKLAADFDFFCKIFQKKIDSYSLNKVIAIYKFGGKSSYLSSDFESIKIINKYFNFFYGFLYFLKRVLIRQILIKLKIINLYRLIRNKFF